MVEVELKLWKSLKDAQEATAKFRYELEKLEREYLIEYDTVACRGVEPCYTTSYLDERNDIRVLEF